MRKSIMSLCKKLVSLFLLCSMIIGCIVGIVAQESSTMNDATEEPASNDVAATDANQSSAVENGAIYALQNAGTGNWAGTATTAATADTHNLYQQSSWVSTSQNFRFVSTGDENNTYYIYPLEYGNQNTDQYRALYPWKQRIKPYTVTKKEPVRNRLL